MTSRRATSVGVWGHYYGANLGDELVTRVIVDEVRRRLPSADIRGYSLDPEDTQRRHGIPAWPITSKGHNRPSSGGKRNVMRAIAHRVGAVLREAPHLWRSYQSLRDVDVLVVAGSGQLLDTWSGAWGHPYTVFKWAALARLARTRMVFLSAGAGPIDDGLARFFIRSAVNWASDISVRDEGSAEVLHEIGVKRPLTVVPDMGFALPVPDRRRQHRARLDPRERERPLAGRTVGLNAMAHANARYWGRGDEDRYDAYVRKMVGVTSALLEQGARVLLFSSQNRADTDTAREVLAALKERDVPGRKRATLHVVSEIDELVETVARCDYVIATRYHSVLLPLLMGIPTLGLAYHPKTAYLMRAARQGAFCLGIDTFTEEQVLEGLRELRRDELDVPSDGSRRRSHDVLPLIEAVHRQFDHFASTTGTFVEVSAVRRKEHLAR